MQATIARFAQHAIAHGAGTGFGAQVGALALSGNAATTRASERSILKRKAVPCRTIAPILRRCNAQ